MEKADYQELEKAAGVKMDCLYQDEIVKLGYNRNMALLQLTFLQQPDTAQFRIAYRLALDTAVNKDANYWLTDARQIISMLPENQAWLSQNMAPLLKSFQIRKFAILMAPECFVMTNPNQAYNKFPPATNVPAAGVIKVHFDKQAALDWLLKEH